MSKLTIYLKTYPHILILSLILLISLFFRTYQIVERFKFAHDGDLYSWMVKDIVVNHHPRLIGQETSAPGIYIGPLFYYSLVPFFLLTQMDPIGALIPITILGVLTTLSYYWVFSKLFNKTVGLIASLLQAILLPVVDLDRWVVPSTPTNIWSIFFFYVVISLVRGNYTVFPLLGLLIGLIWHVHIGLAPSFLAVIVALAISRKLPSKKEFKLFFLGVLIPSIPLILFELKHHFLQTISFISNFSANHGGGSGYDKFNLLMIKMTFSLTALFFSPYSFESNHRILIMIGVLIFGSLVVFLKKLKFSELSVLYSWFFGMVIFFTFSSTLISEYYYANLYVIFIALVSLLLFALYQTPKVGKVLLVSLLAIYLIHNLYYFINQPLYPKDYLERRAIAGFVTADARVHNFPCVAISYYTIPGENTGFRYFFWLNNLKIKHPSDGSPVYTIVIPDEKINDRPLRAKFGHIGVVGPDILKTGRDLVNSCQGENTNLTDPMFGFTSS